MKVPPAVIYFPEADRAEILRRIDECLGTGQLTLGKYGRELEERFAAYLGVRYAVAVNSGTSALEIALRALDVAGKDVLVPTNTFFATVAAVLHAGGRVRFVDCDPATFSLDIDSLRQRIGPETAGLIVVHIGGIITPRMPEIQALCQEHGLFLLEDAAHAHGCMLGERRAGTFGVAGAFSFYPTKVMTSAEGGLLVTNDRRLYEEALIYRDQGKASFLTNQHTRLGYNWRLSEPHAIIGLAQFARLDEFIAHRNRIAAIYDAGLREIGEVTPVRPPAGARCNYYKYIAMLPADVDRAALKRVLRERYDVGLSGEVYELPCHLQPVFAAYHDGPLPQAEDLCARHICLPISAVTTEAQAEYVLASLRSALQELRG